MRSPRAVGSVTDMKEVEVCVSARVIWRSSLLCRCSTRFLYWPSSQSLQISGGIAGDNGTVVASAHVNHNNPGQANHDSPIKR